MACGHEESAIPVGAVAAMTVADQMDADQRYFEAHPDVDEYTRAYVPGELLDEWGVEHPATQVRVFRIAGPMRMRFDVAKITQADLNYVAKLRKQLRKLTP